ncbi:MAG: MJ1477/TM1410 family putative glycoside hydrolase [Pseudomonadales bacterium]
MLKGAWPPRIRYGQRAGRLFRATLWLDTLPRLQVEIFERVEEYRKILREHRTQRLISQMFVAILSVAISTVDSASALEPGSKLALQNLKSWGYQLQRLDVQRAARMPHDLLVIDYSKDGSGAGALTWSELSQLKRKPDGTRRIVLAYLSIGEAEDYRYYWKSSWKKSAPPWLGSENKQWPGNFLTKYWMPEWQRIILSEQEGYLSKIISSGFDGVFLDRVDAHSDWSGSQNARKEMIDFVVKLSQRAKTRQSKFLVFVQNAEELLTDRQYLKHIDGVVKEDMLYGASHKFQLNPKSLRASHINFLKIAWKQGKPVLVVEYLRAHTKKSSRAIREIRELNFTPSISQRELDDLFLPPK